jgi:hypothetical protein
LIIQKGIYEHYKGNQYEVIGTGLLEATEEPVVIYRALYDNPMSEYWVRTVADFSEQVNVNGQTVPRFRKVEN